MNFKLYVEGGGDGKALRTSCRRGFSEFFRKAGLEGRRPDVVACGSRGVAFSRFCTALHNAKRGELPLLLVDSEAAVQTNSGPWQHLQARDNWSKPAEAKDDHAHLMVQCMESWFLADPKAVAGFFRISFPASGPSDVERIPKDDVLKRLKDATRSAPSKGEYEKGKHSFELLAIIDPDLVRNASPHADRMLAALDQACVAP